MILELIYADSVLYVNEYYQEKVSALNVSNGESIWTYSANNNLSIQAITASGLILATVQTNYGRTQLEAIDITSGAKVWSYDPLEVSKTDYASIWAPTIGADGTIYLSGEGNMQALNPDGTLRWVRYSDEHYDRTGFTYLMPGGRLYHNYYGYLKVSSNGLEDGPWPYPYYGDYSNRRVISTSSSELEISQVSNLVVTPGNSRVSVNWSAVESASYYNVYYSQNPNMEPLSTSNMSTLTTSKEIYPLQNGSTYYFQVRAVSTGSEGPGSEVVSSTPRSAYGPFVAPTNFTKVEPDDGTLRLSWNGFGEVDSYRIFYSTEPGLTSTSTYRSITSTSSSNSTSGSYASTSSDSSGWVPTEYTFSDLDSETRYFFRIAAVNSAGVGELSEELSGTPFLSGLINGHILLVGFNRLVLTEMGGFINITVQLYMLTILSML